MDYNPFRKSGVTEGSAPEKVDVIVHTTPLETLYAQNEIEKSRHKRQTKKTNAIIAIVLILSLVAAPLIGIGVGAGARLMNAYVLPRILNDSAQRENFAFENVHTPVRIGETPLVARQNYVDLVNAVKPSVVTIAAELPGTGIFGLNQGQERAGTGIIMYETSTRYYIATNAHVIAGSNMVSVSINGSEYIAAVPIGRDDDNDLAVIAVYKGNAIEAGVYSVTLARFGDSSQAQVGEIVVAIGNAMGEGISVTNGIISATNNTIFVEGIILDVMQTNAAINRGNSGGPLVNAYGEVIGINTAKFAERLAEGMGYAIPSHVAKPILERIMQEGTAPRRPMIGITMDNWTTVMSETFLAGLIELYPDEAADFIVPEQGVLVVNVLTGSPALSAGLQRHDIIIATDGVVITNSDDLIEFMSGQQVGNTVVFTIVRDSSEVLDIPIVLAPNMSPQF
ncbi:MAG: trypsin-like peptidase domain-containing protein [Defluviitaleaceae bacterium]|nr:trypsin-like peptidase domain-containing protein [Defluviitaleaceae bacterium]